MIMNDNISGILQRSLPAPRKTAPMSLVIVLRNSSPLGTLLIERFYPEPLRISGFMLGSIFLMIAGGCHEIPEKTTTDQNGSIRMGLVSIRICWIQFHLWDWKGMIFPYISKGFVTPGTPNLSHHCFQPKSLVFLTGISATNG